MTAERIMLAIYTSDDGKKVVAGMDIDSGRDWLEVFGEAVHVIKENGWTVYDAGKERRA